MIGDDTKIAVAGAGSIGCHAGGCLALAGRGVTLLCRPALADAVESGGCGSSIWAAALATCRHVRSGPKAILRWHWPMPVSCS
jgi:Ketopantoate reductase